MIMDAIPTKSITRKPREVVLSDLDELAAGEAVPTPATSERLGLAERGRDDVLAAAFGMPYLEVPALAFLFTSEADLVDRRHFVLARDDPAAEPPVEADLVATLGEEVAASIYSGGGFLRGSRYTGDGHEVAPSWSGASREPNLCGAHFFF
jgi:hypothetical protein